MAITAIKSGERFVDMSNAVAIPLNYNVDGYDVLEYGGYLGEFKNNPYPVIGNASGGIQPSGSFYIAGYYRNQRFQAYGLPAGVFPTLLGSPFQGSLVTGGFLNGSGTGIANELQYRLIPFDVKGGVQNIGVILGNYNYNINPVFPNRSYFVGEGKGRNNSNIIVYVDNSRPAPRPISITELGNLSAQEFDCFPQNSLNHVFLTDETQYYAYGLGYFSPGVGRGLYTFTPVPFSRPLIWSYNPVSLSDSGDNAKFQTLSYEKGITANTERFVFGWRDNTPLVAIEAYLLEKDCLSYEKLIINPPAGFTDAVVYVDIEGVVYIITTADEVDYFLFVSENIDPSFLSPKKYPAFKVSNPVLDLKGNANVI